MALMLSWAWGLINQGEVKLQACWGLINMFSALISELVLSLPHWDRAEQGVDWTYNPPFPRQAFSTPNVLSCHSRKGTGVASNINEVYQ